VWGGHSQNGAGTKSAATIRRSKPMLQITTILKDFLKEETGQDLVEYALLLVFLALAAIAVLPTLGKAVNNVFSQSASSLTSGS
jgi:pilus assembly protein Flp/PilA